MNAGDRHERVAPADVPTGITSLLPIVVAIGALVLGLVLWQCGDGSSVAAGPTAERGLVAFRLAGCGACHGQTAEGGSGPALGGHSEQQVIRQVRAPFAAMPMFTTTQLDDEDLAAIVLYLDGLAPVDHSVRWGLVDGSGFDPRDGLAAHHWLALTAIRVGDLDEAAHQIDHIKELVTGEHLEAMEIIVALLDSGDTDGAERMVFEMSAGYEPSAGIVDLLNARLAAQALAIDDRSDAIRHLEAAEPGVLGDVAGQARRALDSGARDDAIDLLVSALGDAAPDLEPVPDS